MAVTVAAEPATMCTERRDVLHVLVHRAHAFGHTHAEVGLL